MEPTTINPIKTHIAFDQQEGALHMGGHSWSITGLRFKGAGEEKFRDVPITALKPEFIEKVIAMMETQAGDFTDLSEFTFTLEEAAGLSGADLEKGQKSRSMFDPRRIKEEPTHDQLFKSGKIKCQLCYLKNGKEVHKKFQPKDESEAKIFSEYALAFRHHRARSEKEEEEPLPVKHPEKLHRPSKFEDPDDS